jgi:UDP-glucose 4-epimerase
LCSHKVTSPLIIENDYQKVKAASEEMVNGLKGIIFRVTNVYGVNMNNKTIIKDIHSQLGRKSELILKNGYSVRDFIYIDDVVDCIRKSLSYSGHGVFNLGSGLSYSAYELASIILSITGNNQKIISADPGVNINYLSVDIKETVNFLRWEPRVDLFNGIKKIFLNNEK